MGPKGRGRGLCLQYCRDLVLTAPVSHFTETEPETHRLLAPRGHWSRSPEPPSWKGPSLRGLLPLGWDSARRPVACRSQHCSQPPRTLDRAGQAPGHEALPWAAPLPLAPVWCWTPSPGLIRARAARTGRGYLSSWGQRWSWCCFASVASCPGDPGRRSSGCSCFPSLRRGRWPDGLGCPPPPRQGPLILEVSERSLWVSGWAGTSPPHLLGGMPWPLENQPAGRDHSAIKAGGGVGGGGGFIPRLGSFLENGREQGLHLREGAPHSLIPSRGRPQVTWHEE